MPRKNLSRRTPPTNNMYTTRVSSLDHVPTVGASRVTSCDKCCVACSKWELTIINLLDFLLGLTLCAFGFMLFDKLGSQGMTNPSVSWLCWLSTLIGVLLLLSCFMSACGLNSSGSCRWCVTPSAYIGMLVGCMSLAMSVMVYAKKSTIYDHLNSSGGAYGLAPDEVANIKAWYKWMGFVLLSSFLVEVMRCRASAHYRKNVSRMDGEFDALLAEEDKAYADKMSGNKSARAEKYDNLRDFYKQKYQAPIAVTGTSTNAF